MTLNYKTMPYSNNKYHFTEPFLVYDLIATVNHNGSVFTETLKKAEDTLKSKGPFVLFYKKSDRDVRMQEIQDADIIRMRFRESQDGWRRTRRLQQLAVVN